MRDLSIILPCLNEAETLGNCILKAQKSIEALKLDGEIIVADNGSTDGSLEIAKNLGALVVHVKEKGYGNALRGGIEAATGKWIIMADADDSYDFGQITPFVKKLQDGYDLVMGCRLPKGGGKIMKGAMPWKHRWIGNPLLSGIGRLFFESRATDFHCGMRAFTREAYQRITPRTTGMEFASEMVIKATLQGLRIAEVPITLYKDGRSRPPHLRSWRDGWRHLRFMLLYAPNWLFLLPGTVLMFVGLALTCWLLPGPRHLTDRVEIDIHTMVFGVIFTLMGAQIIAVGFFAKAFSYAERFDRNPRSLKRMLRHVQLEHGLALGGLLFLAGFAGCAWIAWQWAASGFGPLYVGMRAVLFWSMWMFLGLQVIFSSFFLSMLGISRDTYVGDYER